MIYLNSGNSHTFYKNTALKQFQITVLLRSRQYFMFLNAITASFDNENAYLICY